MATPPSVETFLTGGQVSFNSGGGTFAFRQLQPGDLITGFKLILAGDGQTVSVINLTLKLFSASNPQPPSVAAYLALPNKLLDAVVPVSAVAADGLGNVYVGLKDMIPLHHRCTDRDRYVYLYAISDVAVINIVGSIFLAVARNAEKA